jgi:hypothetical protein
MSDVKAVVVIAGARRTDLDIIHHDAVRKRDIVQKREAGTR